MSDPFPLLSSTRLLAGLPSHDEDPAAARVCVFIIYFIYIYYNMCIYVHIYMIICVCGNLYRHTTTPTPTKPTTRKKTTGHPQGRDGRPPESRRLHPGVSPIRGACGGGGGGAGGAAGVLPRWVGVLLLLSFIIFWCLAGWLVLVGWLSWFGCLAGW